MKNKTKFNIAVAIMCIIGLVCLYAIHYFHVVLPFFILCAVLVSIVVYCYVRVSELPEDMTNDNDYSKDNVNSKEE